MEFVLYWHTTPEHFDIPRRVHWVFIKDFPLYKLTSIANYFLVRNGALHPLPPFSGGHHLTWTYTGLVYAVIVCVSLYMPLSHYLWKTLFPQSCLSYFCFLFYLDPWALGAEIWQRHPIYERELQYLVVGLPVNSHLLPKDVSLWRVEWGTDLW